ncbi:MAG: hypothetical protein ACPGKP_05805 [Ilumatobacteraceae bacterium]
MSSEVEAHEGSDIDGPDIDDGETASRAPSLVQRLLLRLTQRPRRWLTSEWDSSRIWKCSFTAFSLAVTTTIMMNVVHLNPLSPGADLIFDDNTPTGGDFGAHVWGPAFLRDHLLPGFRLNGWTMDWYGGMPAYRFYMVLPALAVVLVDVLLPYGVALKLIGVIGLLTLPAACWGFGRLAKFAFPIPELFAFAGLAFLLDESFTIYGGNLKSTMAGEFSFSIALTLAMLALGALAAGLRTGKYRVWTAALIAAAAVSHGIVLIFIAVAALVFTALWVDGNRWRWVLTTGITAFLLVAWWVGPFLMNHEYMTDMKYGPRPEGAEDSFWDMFFPLTAPLDVIISVLAIIGVVWSVLRRHQNGSALGITGLVLVAGVYLARDSLPVIGLLWNPRLLPFLYLVRYMLMMVGAVAVMNVAWNVVKERHAVHPVGHRVATGFGAISALCLLSVLGFMFQVLPGGGITTHNGAQVYGWGPFKATSTNVRASGDGWSSYNFTGYEGRGAAYTEYHSIVEAMGALGDDPAHGCGRALWENSPDNGQYGTTMALMLLPFWTDGCIGSMEALFFEASGTTPYSFLATAAMSKQSSNPVRELRYVDNNASVGVRHLQDLGVKYAMVRTDEAKGEARQQPELTLVASSGPWEVYEVANSDIVVPLAVQPVVVNERAGDQRERHLELGTSWFQHPSDWAAMPADDGPDSWQRIDAVVDVSRQEGVPGGPGRRVDIVVPAEPISQVSLPAVSIDNVVIDQDSIEFEVDQTGVPVLIKVSYFPNWSVEGADEVYRIAPNAMVVVPTSNEVSLTYSRTGLDWVTVLLSLAGIGLCIRWRREGDLDHGHSPAPVELAADDAPADDVVLMNESGTS